MATISWAGPSPPLLRTESSDSPSECKLPGQEELLQTFKLVMELVWYWKGETNKLSLSLIFWALYWKTIAFLSNPYIKHSFKCI